MTSMEPPCRSIEQARPRLNFRRCYVIRGQRTATGLALVAHLIVMSSAAIAAPCLVVTLTGTAGGPQQPFNGLASAGTLVRYGEDRNNCDALKLQFDVGRGTTMRLSQLGVGTEQLNAVFFTH